jgi:methylated-DNA-[protein]-cysteine S-methyltransferase
MTVYAFRIPSPIGSLLLVSEGGALTGLYMEEHRHAPPVRADREGDPGPFREAWRQLDGYFAGERTRFELPLAPRGTPFQRAVWAALGAIGYGTTASYGELARALGRPAAVRAVGAANGRNPLSIVVPCHRVVGAGGDLVGYAGGTERKRFLLELERRGAVRRAGVRRPSFAPVTPEP